MGEPTRHQDSDIRVEVWRGTAEGGVWQGFLVPRHDSQTVLDLVTWIQHYADQTLSYRFACRVGMCGSCAMMVNGVPRWTCRTHVSRVVGDGALRIGPLRNLPVIKDLTTDMDPFFDKWTGAGGQHHPTATRDDTVVPVRPDDPARVAASAGIECINCAVCYAACDTVAGNPDYLGPAALQRAWTLVQDEKDGGRAEVLAAVSGKEGCFNCHSMGSCSQFCPVGLDPMRAIAGLKREALRGA
ncbi:MAG: succinate dehydrogenase/fumarate reductase iron-sulfur subunit [Paracoccaceae bacterium]